MKVSVKALAAVTTAVATTAGATLVAAGAWASGSALGPPAPPLTAPFQQCAAVYQDPSCGYLIDVTGASTSKVLVDPTIGYYEGSDDILVGIQNDSNAPLSSIHVGVAGSGYGSFGFDSDGLCQPGGGPVPADCPFGPLSPSSGGGDYFGPDATLTEDPNPCPGSSTGPCADDGTVDFPTPLQPGQYTYFSLEAPFDGAAVVTGPQNDVVRTSLSDVAATKSGPRLTFTAPTDVTDTATINGGPGGATTVYPAATSTVTYNVYSDPSCTTAVTAPSTVTMSGSDTTAPPSAAFGASLPTNHTYYVQATFSGDSSPGFSPASTNCGDETVTFGTPPTKPAATITTSLVDSAGDSGSTLTVLPNTPVYDTATVTYNGAPQDGRITYYVYSDSSCSTQVPGVNLAGGTSTNGVYPPSTSSAYPLPTGATSATYYFQAIYSGNSTVAGGRSDCTEVLTVKPPCQCANVSAYLNGFATVAGSTKLSFNLRSRITCTDGAGGCASSITLRAPSGATFISNPGKPPVLNGTSVRTRTATLKFSCAGPCLATKVQTPYALSWIALKPIRVAYKVTVIINGKRVVVTRYKTKYVSDPRYLAAGRAGKTFTLTLTEVCGTIKTTRYLRLVFDKYGRVSYAKSDLNGDGRPDGKQLSNGNGFI